MGRGRNENAIWGMGKRDSLATVLGLWIKIVKHRAELQVTVDHKEPVRCLCVNCKKVSSLCRCQPEATWLGKRSLPLC